MVSNMTHVCLGDVAREIKQKVPVGQELPTVGLEHLDPGEVELAHWDEGVETTFTKAFSKGQVLFGRRRAYLRKAAVAPFDGICSGDITVIAPKDNVSPRLLPFIIQNDALFEHAVTNSAGSLSPRVKWQSLSQFEFELPSIAKQEELADILWTAQETRSHYRQLLTACDDVVKSRFVEVFGDPVDGKKWPFVRLEDLCTKLGSGATPRGGKTAYKAEGVPLVRSTNVHNGRFVWKDLACIDDEQAAKLEGVTLMKGDVLLNITGASVARSCLLPDELAGGRVNQHVSIVRVDQKRMLPVLLNTVLISDSYQRLLLNGSRAAGATREAITKEALKRMTVPLPPLELQQEFASFVAQVDKSQFIIHQDLHGF